MTNQELYEKFIKFKKDNKKITYKYIADQLETTASNVRDRFTRLKKGLPVNTEFLIKVEKAIGKPIFFGN